MPQVAFYPNSAMMGSGDGFVSKSLSETERNYAIYDKELLSVIRGLEEWWHILEGTKHKVEILNDHQNLTYFCTVRLTTGTQMIPGEGNIFLEQIKNCINIDEKVVKALKELGTSRNLRGEE